MVAMDAEVFESVKKKKQYLLTATAEHFYIVPHFHLIHC